MTASAQAAHATPAQAERSAKNALLASDRASILKAILAHKFDPLFAAASAAEGKLAVEARKIAYGGYVRKIDAAPEGAFCEARSVEVTSQGRRFSLGFGGQEGSRVTKRVFYQHRGYEPIISVLAGDEFGDRVAAHAEALEAIRKERRDLEKTVTGTLARYRTFEALLSAWPDAAKFVTERLVARGAYVASVPAVAFEDLSAKLDLPPEMAVAA